MKKIMLFIILGIVACGLGACVGSYCIPSINQSSTDTTVIEKNTPSAAKPLDVETTRVKTTADDDTEQGDTTTANDNKKHSDTTTANDNVITAVKDKEYNKVTLSFAGDVLLGGSVENSINQFGVEALFSDAKKVFDLTDIAMVNLENPVSLRGEKAQDKSFTFRARPDSLKGLTYAGIDIVTLANNHILDFGIDALIDTLQNLKAENILYVGAGHDLKEASGPQFIEKNGHKIAFLASSHVIPVTSWAAGEKHPGVATTYDPKRLRQEIRQAKKEADIVVVYVHWGKEREKEPLDYQKNLARIYIDEGADAVIGSHPHVLQGIEYYKHGVVAYSLGNFVFSDRSKDTMVLNIEFREKKLHNVKLIPFKIQNRRPTLIVDEQEKQRLFSELESLSFGVKVDSEGSVIRVDE